MMISPELSAISLYWQYKLQYPTIMLLHHVFSLTMGLLSEGTAESELMDELAPAGFGL